MDQGALHFRAVGESAEWDSGGIGGSLWSVTWHMASYPNPADKLCTWGSFKNWSLPQIRSINYNVWSLSLLKLALIYHIVKPAQVSHRARSWVGGIPSEPISLEHCQISQCHRFLLCLCGTTISSGQNQCMNVDRGAPWADRDKSKVPDAGRAVFNDQLLWW